jgi:hypothetical protein
VPFSQAPTAFPEVPQVQESVQAIKDNLVGALGMDLGKYTYTLGPKLAFNPATEKFVDNPAADKLLTREYRAPYVVPAEV